MADAKKCDICGKFYVPQLGSLLKSGYHLMYFNALTLDSQFDLCPDCKTKLTDFIESMKEKHHD